MCIFTEFRLHGLTFLLMSSHQSILPKEQKQLLLWIIFLNLFWKGNFQKFPGGSDGQESACNVGDLGSSLGWEDPLEEGMATHSSILAGESPRTDKPGGLQSMGLQRVGHD